MLLRLLGWLALAPLTGFVLLRLAGLEGRSPAFVALVTLTLWVLLPAWAVLGLAVALRDRALALAALALVVVHLRWVGPELRWWPHDQPDVDGPTFTIAAANLYAGNARPAEAMQAVSALDADVLVVTELTPRLAALLRSHPHRIVDPRDDAFGSAIYSRFPLRHAAVIDLAGYPTVRATLDVDGHPISLVAVHTPQPLNGVVPLQRQVVALADLVRSTDGPLVLAGDVNATRQHRTFRWLLGAGLRDAHVERGRGRVTSWPVEGPIPFRFALLDHVLVNDGVAVLAAGEATIPGSDHRAVTARLQAGRMPAGRGS